MKTTTLLSWICSLVFCFGINSTFSQTKKTLIIASQELLENQKKGKNVDSLVAFFSRTKIEDFKNELKTNKQKLAFWVNVYNGYIQYSLKKDSSQYDNRREFFNKKWIKIAGETLSFSNIEHGIVRRSQSPIGAGYVRRWFRPKWERVLRVNNRDWRVHFALNCGAKSCPPVAIYDPEKLDVQFDYMTTTYLNEQTSYNSETGIAKSVSLFSWFRGDFGGKSGAKKILKKYGITPEKPKSIKFTTYDWTLLLDNYREIKL